MLEEIALTIGYYVIMVFYVFVIMVFYVFAISIMGIIIMLIWDEFRKKLTNQRGWIKFLTAYKKEAKYFREHGERMPEKEGKT